MTADSAPYPGPLGTCASDVRAPRVLHVITSFQQGGAETMLAKLLAVTPGAPERVEVVGLLGEDVVAPRIRALGVRVHCLGMDAGGLAALATPLKLARIMRRFQPDVVQSWLYRADLLAGLVACVAVPKARRVWNIRTGPLTAKASRMSRLTVKACTLLSDIVPHRIVSCAESAAFHHASLGYPASKIQVIPNGFDTSHFRPDPEARRKSREELGLAPDAFVIGYVARFDPQKDHRTFLRAARQIATSMPTARFVLCGRGMGTENATFWDWVDAEGIRDRIHVVPQRGGINNLMAAFDIAALTAAYGEGFPNILGEAMACGIPCVTTDVGDAALVVGDTGRVVPIGDDRAFAEACLEIASLPRESLSAMAGDVRARVLNRFSVDAVQHLYAQLYTDLLACRVPG